MANRKKCASLGLRLAQSLFSTQSQRSHSQMAFTQVLPLSYLSQSLTGSEHFKSQAVALSGRQRLFSSSPSSVVELLLSNDWSDTMQNQLEESNIEITHGYVVYILKKLDRNPIKAYDFFSWACHKRGFQSNSLTYSLLVRVLADKKTMKQFWAIIQEMKDKGFYVDEGTYLTILGNFKKAKMDKDVVALKHFHQRMMQDNVMDDVVKDVVGVVLGSDWNEKVESKFQEMKISVTENFVLRVLKKLRRDPLKALSFFEWAGKCPGYQHSSVTYNVLARILAQHDSIKEFQNMLLEMRSKGHAMDYDTYIKISRSLQKYKMLKDAVALYEYMMDSPYPPSEQDCILVLKSLSACPDLDLTSRVVKKFEAGGNTLSKAVFDGIHRSLTGVGKFDEAEEIIKSMENAGYKPDNITYSQVVFGLCKGGRLEDACKVLDEMEANGCVPDIKTWTILIQGQCDANRMDMALINFAKMMEKNIDPDADLLDVLVNGFIAQKKLDGAYKLVVEMVERAGLKPWQATYKLITEKLLEAGKLEEALKILPMMKKHDYPPFAEAFVTYISKFGTVEDARTLWAALSVKQLPSASAYLHVLKSFFNEGRYFEAKDLLYSCPPHIRAHKEITNIFGASKSSDTPAS